MPERAYGLLGATSMRRFGAWLVIGSVLCAGAVGACGDSDDSDERSAGGSAGTGGAAGNGGTAGKGGTGGAAGSLSPGGAGGEAGSDAEACPSDFFAADGTLCRTEGKICSDGGSEPCQFGNSLRCLNGEWEWQESFPAPCGGAGGQGGEHAGGASNRGGP
jgi:hypothetical protein